jgi:signal transduction histidine kinase
MRDMLDNRDRYPLEAWSSPLERVRQNLDDAIRKEAALAQGRRAEDQSRYLTASFEEFWRATSRMFDVARTGGEAKARQLVRDTLQPQQEALSALVARLLVQNNDEESRASSQVAAIFSSIERNANWFLGLSMVLITLTSVGVIRSNRVLFVQLEGLAEQRRELARQLISTQESTFRAISRDLHDEFGQILTALGAMLRRADRKAPSAEFREQVQETAAVVQGTLERIRGLSQSLQPVILEEQGLLPAIEWHLPVFERQTGIRVHYRQPEQRLDLRSDRAIHVFRVLQEALNNVARHADVQDVRVMLDAGSSSLRLTIEDAGRGIPEPIRPGVGLTAMRERAELIGGALSVTRGERGGTRVTLQAPIETLQEAPVA